MPGPRTPRRQSSAISLRCSTVLEARRGIGSAFRAAGVESGDGEDARRLGKRRKRRPLQGLVNRYQRWPNLPPRLGPGLPSGPNGSLSMLSQKKSDDLHSFGQSERLIAELTNSFGE